MTSFLPLWASDLFFLLGVACVVVSGTTVLVTWWCWRRDDRERAHWEGVHAGWSAGLDPEERA